MATMERNPSDAQIEILSSDFVLHGDKTKAWRLAYPDSKAKPSTQHSEASTVFNNQKVIRRIEELRIISKKNSEEEFTVTVSKIKKVLAMVIKRGLGDEDSKELRGLSSVVAAARELNAMDGNHKLPDLKIIAEGLTPWSSIEAGIDEGPEAVEDESE